MPQACGDECSGALSTVLDIDDLKKLHLPKKTQLARTTMLPAQNRTVLTVFPLP